MLSCPIIYEVLSLVSEMCKNNLKLFLDKRDSYYRKFSYFVHRRDVLHFSTRWPQ